ncbi:MAG TPA: HNH endonuclease [bacterium]|nr:HNH endonuclease [bacterium]
MIATVQNKKRVPWNKGKKSSLEARRKLSVYLKKAYADGSRVTWNKGVTGWKNPKQSETRKRLFKEGKLNVWNKGISGNDYKKHFTKPFGGNRFKKGNTVGFAKGHKRTACGEDNHFFGKHPWNYIDGRSKEQTPMRYGEDWPKLRLASYKRDGYECKKCGMTMTEHREKYKQGLHCHHIVPFLSTRDNSMDNLITLCKSCHVKEDAELIKKGRMVKSNVTEG